MISPVVTIPSAVAIAWRHCGIYVRGVWLHHGLPERSSQHPDLWQCCVVRRGSLSWTGALGDEVLSPGDVIVSAPGYAVRWQPQTEVDLLEVLFSAIPEPGHQVPWSMLQLPAVAHGVDGSAVARLAAGMQGHRWRDDEAAMTARFVVDRFLWRAIGRGLHSGSMSIAGQRPAWLQDTITAAISALRDPAFSVHDLVRLAGCSHAHLCRTIRKTDGCTPSGLIRRLRVARAAHMLMQDPQTEPMVIVTSCGFGSVSRFRRQWRQETKPAEQAVGAH